MTKKALTTLLVILAITPNFVYAQKSKADSLILILDSEAKNNSTIDALLNLADNLGRDGKFDEAIQYAIIGRRKSEELNYKNGKAKSLTVTGAVYNLKGAFKESLNDLEEAENIYKELNDIVGLGRVNNHLGSTYENLSDFKKGLEHHLMSIEYYKKAKQGEGISTALTGAGINYYKRGSYKVALEYYMEALRVADSIGSNRRKASLLNNLGNISETLFDYKQALDYYTQSSVLLSSTGAPAPYIAKTYSNIAGIQIVLGKYDEARINLDKAFRMRKEIGDKNQVFTLYNYGDLFRKQQKYDSAEYYYNQSLKLSGELNNLAGSLFPIRGLCELYLATKKVNKAEYEFEQGHSIAKKIDSKSWLVDLYKLKVKIDSAKGDYKSSLAWYKLYDHLNDSIFQFMQDDKIAYLESLREPQRKSGVSALQPQESVSSNNITPIQLIGACVATALLVVLLLVIFLLITGKYQAFLQRR